MQPDIACNHRHVVLKVGQDKAGHWLVQEDDGRMEGRFISFTAALAFARAERHAFPDAEVAVVDEVLVPIVAFDPPSAPAMAVAA